MKGFGKTIESVFAVIILISFLLSIRTFYVFKKEQAGYNFYLKLEEADRLKELRKYVYEKDIKGIKNLLDIKGINYTIMICNQTHCYGNIPSASNIFTYSYFISGYERYEPYEVKLIIAE